MALLFDRRKKRIIVIRIVMGKRQPFDPGALGHFYRLFPTAVSPALFLLQLLRRILRVVNKQIGALRKLDHPAVDAVGMLDVRAKHQHPPVHVANAVAVRAAGVMMLERLDVFSLFGKTVHLRLMKIERRAHFIQRNGKIFALHGRGKDVFQIFEMPALADGADGKVAPAIVRRQKEGKALQVIPVKMRKADEDVFILLMPAGEQVFSEIADAGAGVQDGNVVIGVRQHHARRVAAKFLIVALTNRDGAARPIKFDFHVKILRRFVFRRKMHSAIRWDGKSLYVLKIIAKILLESQDEFSTCKKNKFS